MDYPNDIWHGPSKILEFVLCSLQYTLFNQCMSYNQSALLGGVTTGTCIWTFFSAMFCLVTYRPCARHRDTCRRRAGSALRPHWKILPRQFRCLDRKSGESTADCHRGRRKDWAARYGGPVCQASTSFKNSSGSCFSGGTASLMELEPFWKMFGKTISPSRLRW
jgi:hypothetical protein